MPKSNSDISSQGLESALRALRRRWYVVFLCALVAGGAALIVSLAQQKRYTASSSLLFRDTNFDQTLFGALDITPSNDPQREAATNFKLVSLPIVADMAARDLGGLRSGAEILSELKVAAQGEANLVSIEITDRDPEVAARLANGFATQYIAFRRAADRAKIAEARRLVDRQIASLTPDERSSQSGRSLQARSEQLSIMASLQTGNAELVQRATAPTTPAFPKTTKNVAMAILLALLVSGVLVIVLDRLDRRIRDSADLEALVDLPVLGVIPFSRSLSRNESPSASITEGFRLLRARLRYFNVDRDIRSVVVTSAQPGDGKSTIAWYMAEAAAESSGERVILIEADLRRPTFLRDRSLDPGPGLAELLTQQFRVDEVVRHVRVRSAAATGAPTELAVIPAGAIPPNPSELLDSHKMSDLLTQLKEQYSLVIVDTPPTSIVSDAIPLLRQTDGVIVVCRYGRSTRDSLVHFTAQLRQLNAPVFGLVANAALKRRRGFGREQSYGYGYGYGYGEYFTETNGTTAEHSERLPAAAGDAPGSRET